MKSKNGGILIFAGLAIAIFVLSTNNNQGSTKTITDPEKKPSNPGNVSKSYLIQKYLNAIGMPEGQPKLEEKWNKMTVQQIIEDAKQHYVVLI